MRIVGVERVDYNKKTGEEVKGFRFHLTEESKEAHGLKVDSIFLYDDKAARFVSGFKAIPEMIGVEVRPYRNQYGRAEDLDRLG